MLNGHVLSIKLELTECHGFNIIYSITYEASYQDRIFKFSTVRTCHQLSGTTFMEHPYGTPKLGRHKSFELSAKCFHSSGEGKMWIEAEPY